MKAAEFDEKKQIWIQRIQAKEFYSVRETAIILCTGAVSVRDAIKRGTMAGVRVNGVVRVRHEAINDYIAKRALVPGVGAELIIEDIIPDKRRATSHVTASLIPNGTETGSPEDLSFLDED